MTLIARYPALATGLVIGLIMAAGAYAAGGGAGEAAVSFGIVAGYAVLVTIAGTRNETASALAGRPVDERWEHIGLEACAVALGVSSVAVLAGFLVAQVSGGDWKPYALIACVMGLSYLGSVVLLRARH